MTTRGMELKFLSFYFCSACDFHLIMVDSGISWRMGIGWGWNLIVLFVISKFVTPGRYVIFLSQLSLNIMTDRRMLEYIHFNNNNTYKNKKGKFSYGISGRNAYRKKKRKKRIEIKTVVKDLRP